MNGHRAKVFDLREQNPAYRQTPPSIPQSKSDMKIADIFFGFTHIGPLHLPVDSQEEAISFYTERPHILPVASSIKGSRLLREQVAEAFSPEWNGFKKSDSPFLANDVSSQYGSLLVPFPSPREFLKGYSTSEISSVYANVIKWLLATMDVNHIAPLFLESNPMLPDIAVPLSDIYSFLYVFSSELQIPIGIVTSNAALELPSDFQIVKGDENRWAVHSAFELPNLEVPWGAIEADPSMSSIYKAYEGKGPVAS